MNDRLRLSRHFLVTVFFAAALLPLQARAADPTGDAATGQRLFQSSCVYCHKVNGKGGESIGAAVSADLDGPSLENRYKHNDHLLALGILDGVNAQGQQLNKVMPRYRGHVTPQQVADLIAYIKTLHE